MDLTGSVVNDDLHVSGGAVALAGSFSAPHDSTARHVRPRRAKLAAPFYRDLI